MEDNCKKCSEECLKHIREVEGISPYIVWADIYETGEDIQIIVGGGHKPHIGAVALAEPTITRHPVTGETVKNEGSERSCKVTAVSGEGHKEKEVAIAFAEEFCAEFGVNVVATVGIHIDNATPEEIIIFKENINLLIVKSKRTWALTK